jgi:hypothetical protein
MSNNNHDKQKWKYCVGDLVCCPRSSANETWGSLLVLQCVQTESIKYYECFSQKANRIISMPKKVLESGWYEPGV